MSQDTLGFGGFATRFGFALILVLATFNPSGWSYFHWVAGSEPHFTAPIALAGIVLLAAWIVYGTATVRSLGLLGVILTLAFFGALVWLVISQGWLAPGNTRALVWIALVVVAAVLAMGMSWSFMRRSLTGQADVDQVDHR